VSAQTARLSVTPKPYGKPGGPGLYGVKGQKHSDYFEQIVGAMMKNGKSKGEASAMAWGILRRWARGGGNVHPEVRAAAIKALAEEKTKVHAHSNISAQVIELFNPNHGPGGQFASAPGSGAKAAKIKAIRGKLRSIQSQIVTTRAAIEADIKAKKATKKSASKTIGKSAKQQAASAKASAAAKASATKKTATKTKKAPSLAALQSKLTQLRAQRKVLLGQLAAAQKGK